MSEGKPNPINDIVEQAKGIETEADAVDFVLKMLGRAPPAELKQTIINKQNIVKEFEVFLLPYLKGQTLRNVYYILKIPREFIFSRLNQVAESTQMVQLKLLNTKEGHEFIALNLDALIEIVS